MTSAAHDFRARQYLLGALCVSMVCGILIVALRPFHSPKNQVFWVPNEDAVRIGPNGTLLSSGRFRSPGTAGSACTVEMWFESGGVWRRGTVLSFYDPLIPTSLSIRQHYTSLLLQLGRRSPRKQNSPSQLEVAATSQAGEARWKDNLRSGSRFT